MTQLKEILNVLLDEEKLLNKPHGGKNSYWKMQNNHNSSTQTPLSWAIMSKNQNINIQTNIKEKLKGYVKINTFYTFYESF